LLKQFGKSFFYFAFLNIIKKMKNKEKAKMITKPAREKEILQTSLVSKLLNIVEKAHADKPSIGNIIDRKPLFVAAIFY
jgi:hypothetical protein